VKNENAFTFQLGADYPVNDWFGFRAGYQYLKVKENIIGYFQYQGEEAYWHDPVTRDLSTYNIGMYVRF